MFRIRRTLFGVLLLGCLTAGCGTTKSRLATEQLLMSDAVDRSIASIDFRPLSGRSVYLDTQYVKNIKGNAFVNADYIISSLRQQMLAAHCYLEENAQDADYIAEVRVGALGTDAHDVTYGIPASNALSSAASLVPNAPAIPLVPEISLARRTMKRLPLRLRFLPTIEKRGKRSGNRGLLKRAVRPRTRGCLERVRFKVVRSTTRRDLPARHSPFPTFRYCHRTMTTGEWIP